MTEVLEMRPITRPPDATVRVPGSKSITNRAVLLAALAKGRSELTGALFSDDTRYMIESLRRLGVAVEVDEAAARITVDGCGGEWPVHEADLYVGNAGTAMRFLIPALCLRRGGKYRIDGSARMRERPVGELVMALKKLKVDLTFELVTGNPPVVVEAEGLLGGETELGAQRSSQFVSALLMVGSYAEHGVAITLTGPVIAHPYIEMTIAMMATWGVSVQRDDYKRFVISAGQRYRAQRYVIEPDASSAHYFLAAAALTGGRVRVLGLGRDSIQGDVRFADILERMGASVTWGPDGIEVVAPETLHGIDADLNAISDTAPTLAAIAPFASGPVRIRNVAHLRWQESDRLRAVTAELTRLGGHVRERGDGLEIEPAQLHGGDVATYDDHRIAMAFALIGLRVPGIRIENPDCVAKTFPNFFEKLEQLRR